MDRYEIDGFTGQVCKTGVFLAKDKKFGKQVVLKLFCHLGPMNRDSLLHTGAQLQALHHSHVVQFLDCGVDEEANVYYVQEYLDGKPLNELVPSGQGLSFEEAWPIVSKLADALQAVHSLGVLHLDLKPANILMVKGEPKIIDFGALKSEEGFFQGTPGYVAPEIIRGEIATVRSDIYSFGALLAYMLTGQKLYSGDSPSHILAHQLNYEAACFSNEPLGVVIARATRMNPNRRYASIEEMQKPLALYAHERGLSQKERSENLVQSTFGRCVMGALILATIGIYYFLLSSI
ncbi:MAG: serine/threonine protein kinase [Myxococcaceae bacterium]|nr:serine/threonine protein kinase [Myxococcaceae bacterium]MBH2006666.1 serine/threonine protein kinase [Myxococcaceae bacterium]